MMTDAVVEVKDLVKTYGSIRAVDGISISVARGEVFGMLGPNGAGKTTTVEIIEGLRTADSGAVRLLGMDVSRDIRAIKERIGVQSQHPALFPNLTVEESINFFRTLYKSSLPASDIIGLARLEESRRVLYRNLSGGQQQRLSVALAFVNDPDVLFLDEPTTGLDPQARRAMWEVVESFHGTGKTVVLTTHYMEEAQRLCDRVAIIDHGKVIAHGAPGELIASLGAEHVVEFAVGGGVAIPDDTYLGLPGVEAVAHDAGRVRLTASRVHVVVPRLMHLLQDRGLELQELTTHHATLEDVFLALTGRHLRDG